MTYASRVDNEANDNSENIASLSLHSHEWEQHAPAVAVQVTTARRTKTGHRHSRLRTDSWSFISFMLLCLSLGCIDAHVTSATTPRLYGEYSSVISGGADGKYTSNLKPILTMKSLTIALI